MWSCPWIQCTALQSRWTAQSLSSLSLLLPCRKLKIGGFTVYTKTTGSSDEWNTSFGGLTWNRWQRNAITFFGFSDIKHKEYPQFRELGSIKTQLMIKIIKKNHNRRPAFTETCSSAKRRLKLLWSAQEAVAGPSPPWNAGTGSGGRVEKCGFLALEAQWDMRGFQSRAQRRVMKLRTRRMSWVQSVHL